MSTNKTIQTSESVDDFLQSVSDQRAQESRTLITLMQEISGEPPKLWGPSIIGFGSQHYHYDTGREGDMGVLGFSPRKANLTIYFNEGFDRYSDELSRLGKHSLGVSCLYVKQLSDIDMRVLREMLIRSCAVALDGSKKPTTVDEYIASVPASAKPYFEQLRRIIKAELPHSEEMLSYGIVGYKVDEKRARVYIAGWEDHVSLYPIPKAETLQSELRPYKKGKGTLWFGLDTPLPQRLISQTVRALVE